MAGTPPAVASPPRGTGAAAPLAALATTVFAALAAALALENSWPGWRDGLHLSFTFGPADPWRWAAMAHALGGHVVGLGVAALLGAGFLGAGAPARAWLLPRAGRTAWTTVSLVAGFGVVTLLGHGLGLTGLLAPRILAAAAGLLVAGGLRGARRAGSWRACAGRGPGRVLPLALTLGCLGACFLLTRLPDTHEDARVYHFAAPEHYLARHKIHAEPNHFGWHVALGAEMTYLAPWAFGGITTAKAVNLVTLVALCLVLFRLVRVVQPGAGADAGWLACGLVLATGLVAQECWEGKNDLAAMLAVTAAAWCAAEAATGRRSWWPGAAWFLGQAAGVKYPVIFAAAGLLVAMMVSTRRRPGPRSLAGLAALAALPAIGWPLESWLLLGNPAYPVLSGLFPTLGWGPFYEHALHAMARAISPESAHGALDLLTGFPRAIGLPVTGSVALLALAPLALAGPLAGPAGLLRTTCLAGTLAWLCSERMARYLAPLLPLLAVLAATLPASGAALPRRLRSALLAAAAAMFAAGAATLIRPEGWRFLAGQADAEAVRGARYTTWNATRLWVNAHVPADARIVATGEERRLWFTPRVMSYSGVTEPFFWKLAHDSFTPEEMRKRVRQRGVTHQLFNFVSMEFRTLNWYPGPAWTPTQLVRYAAFVRSYERTVYTSPEVDNENGGFIVSTFLSRPATDRPIHVAFLPGAEQVVRQPKLLVNAGRWAEAVGGFASVLGVAPGVDAWEGQLGLCAARTGRWAEALRWTLPGVTRGLRDSTNLSVAGEASLHLGRLDEAERLIRECLERYPSDRPLHTVNLAAVFLQRGTAAFNHARLDDAGRDLDRVMTLLATVPEHVNDSVDLIRRQNWAAVHAARGELARLRGNREEAIALFQRALAIDPTVTGADLWAARLRSLTGGLKL